MSDLITFSPVTTNIRWGWCFDFWSECLFTLGWRKRCPSVWECQCALQTI